MKTATAFRIPSCGGNDCDEKSIYRTSIPGPEADQVTCNDDLDNDCDGKIDLYGSNGYPPDDDCPTPTPTPTPTDTGGGEEEPTEPPDPCQGDECCGRGTHTECTGGWCDPGVEVCWNDPYTGRLTCIDYPPDCEPEVCIEVCN